MVCFIHFRMAEYKEELEGMIERGQLYPVASDFIQRLARSFPFAQQAPTLRSLIVQMCNIARSRGTKGKTGKPMRRWLQEAAKTLDALQVLDRDWISTNVSELPKLPSSRPRSEDIETETRDIRLQSDPHLERRVENAAVCEEDILQLEDEDMEIGTPPPSILDSPRKEPKPVVPSSSKGSEQGASCPADRVPLFSPSSALGAVGGTSCAEDRAHISTSFSGAAQGTYSSKDRSRSSTKGSAQGTYSPKDRSHSSTRGSAQRTYSAESRSPKPSSHSRPRTSSPAANLWEQQGARPKKLERRSLARSPSPKKGNRSSRKRGLSTSSSPCPSPAHSRKRLPTISPPGDSSSSQESTHEVFRMPAPPMPSRAPAVSAPGLLPEPGPSRAVSTPARPSPVVP